jgi:hypothetical protein
MIQDYCRENKVAIHFFSKEQLDMLIAAFCGSEYKESIPYIEGFVSFTRVNQSKNVTWNYRCSGPIFSSWYKDYTILTAAEFLELSNEQVSILELMG